MKNTLILVSLNEEQIFKAKAINGESKRITHGLLCGSYGRIFGTEKQCSKYYNSWKDIFKGLFFESKTVQACDVLNYESTFNLVNILIAASDENKNIDNRLKPTPHLKLKNTQKKGFWSRIFGKA